MGKTPRITRMTRSYTPPPLYRKHSLMDPVPCVLIPCVSMISQNPFDPFYMPDEKDPMDIVKSLTTEMFKRLDCEGVVGYLRAVRKQYRLNDTIISAVETSMEKDEDIGEDLLEMEEDELLNVLKEKKAVRKLMKALARFRTEGKDVSNTKAIERKTGYNEYKYKSVSSQYKYKGASDQDKTIKNKLLYDKNEIKKGKRLGEGNFANTHLAGITSENNRKVALKIPKVDKAKTEDYKKEMMGLLQIPRQRNIVRLVGLCNYEGVECFLVEYCDQGSLDKLHQKLQLKEEKNFFQAAKGLFLGLSHLHLNHFVHRDIACRNLLVATDETGQWYVKIGDFGLLRRTQKSNSYYFKQENRLPWPWGSPTSLEKKKFNEKSDMWAAGVVCWEMLTEGEVPYSHESSMTIIQKIMGIIQGSLKLPIPTTAAKALQDLTKACLTFEDDKRPTAHEVLIRLIPNGKDTILKHGSKKMKQQVREDEKMKPLVEKEKKRLDDILSKYYGDKNNDLLEASENGHTEVVKHLVEKKASLEAKDNDGRTPLHLASRAGKIEVVKLLVERKADLDSKDNFGYTPLSLASIQHRIKVVKFLVERKADLDAKDETPLSWASKKGHTEVVKFLVEKKASLEAKEEDGRTPLHLASEKGHTEVVKFLVENKADLEAKNINDRTPLHLASEWGRTEVVKFLVERKASLEAKDNDGQTPLSEASENGHTEIVKFLVEHLVERKADLDAKDKWGYTPLIRASGKGHLEVVKFLVEKKANLEAKDINGRTPLHLASEWGRTEVVKFLVEKKASLEAKNINGRTPLHLASEWGRTEVVKFLVERKASLEAKDNDGQTPLSEASENGHTEIVKFLVERKADLDAKDNGGDTPLSGASENGHTEVVKFLVERKADVNAKTNNGNNTPLILASKKGHTAVVDYLKQHGAM